APSVTAPFRAELSANPAETVVEGLDWPPESPDNQYHLNK
ncbi:TPA: hypothetical protein ACHGYI_004820, partial [Escherichia coli]